MIDKTHTNSNYSAPDSLDFEYTVYSLYLAEKEELLAQTKQELETQEYQTSKPDEQVVVLRKTGLLLQALGRYNEARSYFQQALTICSSYLKEKHLQIAQSHHEMGVIEIRLGQYQSARFHLNKAIQIRKELLEPTNLLIAQSLTSYGELLEELGKYDEAITYHENALQICQNSPQTNHYLTIQILNSLSAVILKKIIFLYRYELFEKVEDLLKQAIQINELLPAPVNYNKAISLYHSGTLLMGKKQSEDARISYQKAQEMLECLAGDNHPLIASLLNGIAVTHEQLTIAHRFYENALNHAITSLGRNHPNNFLLLYNYGRLLKTTGDIYEAIKLVKESLKLSESQLGLHHIYTYLALSELGNCVSQINKLDEAQQYLDRAYQLGERLGSSNSPLLIRVLIELGLLRLEQKKYKEAEKNLSRALNISYDSLGDHLMTAYCLEAYSDLYYTKKDFPKAREHITKSLFMRQKILHPDHPIIGRNYSFLGLILTELQDFQNAQQYFEKALALANKGMGTDSISVAIIHYNMGYLFAKQKKYPEARTNFETAKLLMEAKLGQNSSYTKAAQKQLKAVKRKDLGVWRSIFQKEQL